MKDLNIIVNILCNYYNYKDLEPVESEILSEWLDEAQAHEDFLNELSDDADWIKDSPPDLIHEIIRSKLISLNR
jgi:hypothetical protein